MNELITLKNLDILTIILTSSLADSTKVKYCRAVEGYLAKGYSLTNADALNLYAAQISPSVAGNLKSALRLWSKTVEKKLKGMATPDTVHQIQAALWRLEAMGDAIEAPQQKGQKVHTWLNQSQVKRLQATCDTSELQGRRDKAILGVLVGSGVRREEMSELDFDHRALVPVKGKFRTVLNVRGKGAKDRAVPINDDLAAYLDQWRIEVGPGRIARGLDNRGNIYPTLSPMGVFRVVNAAGVEIGLPELAPHDLRRTYAQLGYQAGVPITQISKLLGHASLETTMRYLYLNLDLESTIGDFIPFE
jgi:integrase